VSGHHFLARVTRLATATSSSNTTGAVTAALVLVVGAFLAVVVVLAAVEAADDAALALLLAVGAVKSLAPALAVRRLGAAVAGSFSSAGVSSTLTARVVRVARALGFEAASSATASSGT
jgi:hypothetical protein